MGIAFRDGVGGWILLMVGSFILFMLVHAWVTKGEREREGKGRER